MRKKVLVVDDNLVNLDMAREALDPTYLVVKVTSGPQALKYLSKNSTDLILLDINMPGMNGYETLAEIRKLPFCKDIPVVFVTAFDDKESVEFSLRFGREYGVMDYIVKPYSKEDLLARVSKYIKG